MSRSLMHRCSASAVILLVFSAIFLASESAARAELITYFINPYSHADYIDKDYTDTLTGTIAIDSSKLGKYVEGAIGTGTTLKMVLTVTKTRTGFPTESITDSVNYGSYDMTKFVNAGIVDFTTSGIYLSDKESGQNLKGSIYIDWASNYPRVDVSWNRASGGITNGTLYINAYVSHLNQKMNVTDYDPYKTYGTGTWQIASIPEPATFIFFSLGLMGMAAAQWKRRRAKQRTA